MNKGPNPQIGETMRKKYGADYYRLMGSRGGKASSGGGFAADPIRASRAGRLGGLVGRRGEHKLSPEEVEKIKKEYEG